MELEKLGKHSSVLCWAACHVGAVQLLQHRNGTIIAAASRRASPSSAKRRQRQHETKGKPAITGPFALRLRFLRRLRHRSNLTAMESGVREVRSQEAARREGVRHDHAAQMRLSLSLLTHERFTKHVLPRLLLTWASQLPSFPMD